MSGHLDERVWELALGALDGDERRRAEAHVKECARCRAELDGARETLGALALDAASVPPSPAARARLLSSVTPSRWARFVGAVAELVDLPRRRARELLDGIDDPKNWGESGVPGIGLYHLVGGPRTAGAVVGFIRVGRGETFPPHEHYGDETAICLQGRMLDSSGKVYGPGDVAREPKGSTHSFRAGDDEDLVYVVVVHDGVKIGDVVYRAGAPGL